MTPTVRRALVTVAALPLAVAAVSCTTPGSAPDPEPPRPTGEAAEACEALALALPEDVSGAVRGALRTESPYVAVWGDPAVTLRCGVPRPAVLTPESEEYDPTADAVTVNDVSWLVEEQSDGYRFTTTERTVQLEVVVPGAYAPEVNALADLAEAVGQHLPLDPLWQNYYG